MFFSSIIGRKKVSFNEKSIYSSRDVAREGYLYKLGSWRKNWKKRFAVLRKDTRELCFYVSNEKDSLVIVSEIKLNNSTQINQAEFNDLKNSMIIYYYHLYSYCIC